MIEAFQLFEKSQKINFSPLV
ncbi:Hypothetical protein HEAR1133 [Herminiimonas arsenicoxydans]|uniref:Uncharacterized protein n=1 Tax=Herminiimonas arsenicoxydans TaxID=204773 RepID=A4G475_HERAR|nr:Hypothetical protein HEAR1133 [Herminiimonas arsenicoxydans]